MSFHREKGLVWLRVGHRGPGVLIKDRKHHPPLFSERNGYWWMIRVGRLVVRYLPRMLDPGAEAD